MSKYKQSLIVLSEECFRKGELNEMAEVYVKYEEVRKY